MNKDKLENLTKYANSLKDKLSSPVPPKHAGHPESYKQFLTRELSIVTSAIETAKLAAAPTK